jgi:hypothetical protein
MKILHVAPSPKAGISEHMPNQRAQGLIDAGFAVAVPKPPRGSSEWLAAMAEEEQQRVALIPADQRDAAPSPISLWSVRYLDRANKHVVVMNHLTTEIIYGETVLMEKGRPDFKATEKQFVATLKKNGCPQSTIQKYLDAKSAPDFLAREVARIEADKSAAETQRQHEREAPKFI